MDDDQAGVFTPRQAVVGNGNVLNGTASGLHSEREQADMTAEQSNSTQGKVTAGRRSSVFWNTGGPDELNWYVPPLPDHADQDGPVEGMLDRFGELLRDHPRRAWLLKWNYRTRAAATGAELAGVEREAQSELERRQERSERDVPRLDTKISLLRERQEKLEAELVEAKKEFAECAARAGLNCGSPPDPTPPVRRGRKAESVPPDLEVSGLAHISPQRVEEALGDSRPTLHEMAGEHGIGPIGRHDLLSTILQFLMQFLAPLVAGLLLALCLGTLVGILDVDTFQRADSVPQLALSAALGFVIVYLMGEIYHTAVGTLARSLESRPQWEGGTHLPVPRHRSGMGLAIILVCAALFLGLAEITAEGMGIKMLHDQQVTRAMRFRAPNQPVPANQEIPFAIFMLIGTLISGPYLVFKSAKGWSENENELREAWLNHRQRVWLEERRAEPDVQQTFHRAYVVEHLEHSLQTLKSQLHATEQARDEALKVDLTEAVQKRRQSAREAAVGEAARLQKMLEEIVETSEPMPAAADRRGKMTGSRFNGGPR